MRRARKTMIAIWTAVLLLNVTSGLSTAAGAGLFAPSVEISPAVLLVLTLTPAETLTDWGTELLKKRFGFEKE